MAILEVKLVDQPLALLAWEELVVLWQNEQTALEWKFFITTETGVKQMRKNLVRYFVRVQDAPLLRTSPSIVQSATLFKARTWFISFCIQNCVVEYPISMELDFFVEKIVGSTYSRLLKTQTLANSNIALPRTRLDFLQNSWSSYIYCTFTLDKSNLPLTRSYFCFPSDHFHIILPGLDNSKHIFFVCLFQANRVLFIFVFFC